MYGVVLMVAMAGGAESPALFGRNKGCSGCTGYVSAGCSGTVSSGCSGCSGRKRLFHKKHKGCHGGCSGVAVVSCSGSAPVACYGSAPVSYAPPAVGCSGSAGISYGAPMMGAPMMGAPMMGAPMMGGPTQGMAPTKKGVEPLKKAPKEDDEVKAAPALITVSVPSDARLSIDGEATESTETTRVFESPALTPGKSYTYTLSAEFVRDGRNVVVTRNVKVKAGSTVEVSLETEGVVASR